MVIENACPEEGGAHPGRVISPMDVAAGTG